MVDSKAEVTTLSPEIIGFAGLPTRSSEISCPERDNVGSVDVTISLGIASWMKLLAFNSDTPVGQGALSPI